MAVDNVAT